MLIINNSPNNMKVFDSIAPLVFLSIVSQSVFCLGSEQQRPFGHSVENSITPSNSCPTPAVLSCSEAAESTNTCCVVSPGGALVHVQFWDTGFGVADSFGIHGLWPDKCSGRYVENCDRRRDYSAYEISRQLPDGLRSYMETYWVSNDESPEDFWAHEWRQHGTCVSTLEPSCFSDYETAAEVEPYFATVVNLFQSLNTYKALVDSGITPSYETTYYASDMQNAIIQGTGYTPDLVCSRSGELTSVQYYLLARGPLQNGQFEQGSSMRSSNCPEQITWPPKTVSNDAS